jgi:hypothetical protein
MSTSMTKDRQSRQAVEGRRPFRRASGICRTSVVPAAELYGIQRVEYTDAHHARLTSPSNTAIGVWPLADPLPDWEVLT